jgi:hypothetical protein
MNPLTDEIPGAEHQLVGGVRVDVVRAGSARVKRLIYPAGFRWSKDMQPVVKTESCLHAHVGFLAQGRIRGAYADGCAFDYTAPCVVAIEGGHDAWVDGEVAAVLVQFDAEQQTARLFGLSERHTHG